MQDRKGKTSREMGRGKLDREDGGGASGVAAMARHYQGFNPAAYLQYNYTPPRADFSRADSVMRWKLGCLHRAFTEGDIQGETLVDIGSGPTLYQVLSGCEVFSHVVLTDFLDVNRQELRRWLAGEEGDFDWAPYLQHVCQLEGRSPSAWREKAARLRSVVSDVLPIDVHQASPLAEGTLPPSGADCLVSSFCLESVSPDLPCFTQALRHIGSLLRPGGCLLLIGALGETYYMGGPGVRIPVVPLDETQVCASLRASGYLLIQLCVYRLPADMKVGVDDVTGIFYAKVKKVAG
nr:phenylethanolamine N-methyltransferase [Paramormyrops kingsleyae]